MVVVSRGIFLHFLEGVEVGSDDVELSEDRILLASSDAVCERVRLSFTAALVLLASCRCLDNRRDPRRTGRDFGDAEMASICVLASVRCCSTCKKPFSL